MKTISSGLLASNSLCTCLYVARSDGVIERFTSTDANVVRPTTVVAGVDLAGTYLTAPGLDISSIVSQSALAVDNLDLTVLPDETNYPQSDILAGRWDNASFFLFECDFTDSSLGINLLKRGTTGETDIARSSDKFEFRGLKQALQQNVGRVTTKTCGWEFGSQARPKGLCTLDVAAFTFTYAVTAVVSSQQFTCSGAAEASDYYGEGIATSLDGANQGYAQKVKTFASGAFFLALPMPFEVEIGDTFAFTAGCRKRWDADCRDKFSNILNFGGEKDTPGADALTADPAVTSS